MFDTDQVGLTYHVHSWILVSEFSIHNLLEIYRCEGEGCPSRKYLSFDPKTQMGKVMILPEGRN